MPCHRSAGAIAAVFLVYVLAHVLLSANPRSALQPHAVQLLLQATNVTALVFLLVTTLVSDSKGGCESGRHVVLWITLGLLTVNLLVRLGFSVVTADADEQSAKFTRWDRAAAVLGSLAVLAELYYSSVPRKRLRTTMFALGLLFFLPLLTAVPSFFNGTRPDPAILRGALAASAQAYVSYDGKDHATRVLGTEVGGTAYISFAGTENGTDAKIDMSIGDKQVPEEWGLSVRKIRAHAGFVNLYSKIRAKVLALAERHPTDAPIVCCGHSLGGALATLAAMDLAAKGRVVHMYSFGAPQVGDAAFAVAFDAGVPHAVRVVNPFDPVPRSLSAQFVHTKGYYAVSSWTKDTPLTAHFLGTYEVAIGRPGWMRVAGVFAPLVYIGASLLVIAALHRFVS